MTRKELELENARLRGENEALRAQNALLLEALRPTDHGVLAPYVTTCGGTNDPACLHLNCPTCKGTGIGPTGPCVHMVSCPCPRCSPTYMVMN